MTDISELFDRLKSNKYALPAIAIGVIAGGYVLIKSGGLSGLGSAAPAAPNVVTPPGSSGSSGSGSSGDTSGGFSNGNNDAVIASLQQNQQTFQQSLVDQFNGLVSNVQAAITGQQQSNQQAIDQITAQAQQQAQYGSQSAMSNLPDFNSLYAAIAAIPAQLQASYQSPNMPIAQSNLNGSALMSRLLASRRNPVRINLPPPNIPNIHIGVPRPAMTNLQGAQGVARQIGLPIRLPPPRLTVTGHAASSNRTSNRLTG